jgi:hypothetical protein
VPSVTIIDLTGADIQDGAKKGHEHTGLVIATGVPPLPAVALNRVLVTAIKSEAGTPLRETSPTAKHR